MTTTEQLERIRELKRQKGVVVLAHYYMEPELQRTVSAGGIADYIGDSLGLSLEASRSDAEHIVFCGVHFMAETAKILNPARHVYIPDPEAGCSLAASITAADVRELRRQYPGVPVMTYINTTAETKAECDVCCTSRNAVAVARAMEGDRLIFIPDKFMGQNLRERIRHETGKELILWNGACEVHEQFTGTSLQALQLQYPEAELLVHWEVPAEAVDAGFSHADGVLGSTTDIIRYAGESRAQQFILASECDLGATLRGMYSNKEFITPCIRCPYMKKITPANTLRVLESIGSTAAQPFEVNLPEDIMRRARVPIERMLQFQ